MDTQGKIKTLIVTFSVLIILITSCVDFEPVSVIPEISFISFDVVDTYDSLLQQTIKAGKLEFDYIDGDADIGVYYEIKTDTTGFFPDSAKYNLVITVNDKIDGIYKPKVYWNKIEDRYDTLIIYQTIEYDQKLDRVGQNKTIKGIIRSNLQIASPQDLKDTFRLEFYIRDRALNKSNVEFTDDYFIIQ